MITNNDISAVKLSPTKKDFYQIWNELLTTARAISERWDPTSTNESDPGIVLLKVLTGVADVLNYNIDKNILEAFMPSAAQEESMRKLTEMMGYNMKYYQSATTKVVLVLSDAAKRQELSDKGLVVPQFTPFSNADKTVNYVTIEDKTLNKNTWNVELDCIEGQAVECETDNDNIISMRQLDDYHRYYLPETQIAENGIFVYNISDGNWSERWKKVENLNTQVAGTLCYKFGFDSRLGRPYLQFPDDIAHIIEDGLVIYYIRTSGINGNISSRTLTTFELPEAWEGYELANFIVKQDNAAGNGVNVESLTQAYNGFKKTIGTFDTLVTCRDYMNKIYQLVDTSNIPLVSNVIVSDIRDDINHAATVCSFDEFGLSYVNKTTGGDGAISNFDLVLYPFTPVGGLGTQREFEESFKYYSNNISEIKARIEENKTLAHNIIPPAEDDIVCIKNYLQLNAKITTTYKVNYAEEKIILGNIKAALFNAFNMRKLDFGEEIPFDSILETIENADPRIKNVSLDEPTINTYFAKKDGTEIGITETKISGSATENAGQKLYNKLALRNILAGRIALFDYNTDFKTNFKEVEYPAKQQGSSDPLYAPVYPKSGYITTIQSECAIDTSNVSAENPIELGPNETIKFRAPNLKTTLTYPAYINYYLHLNNDASMNAVAATFEPLSNFLTRQGYLNPVNQNTFNEIKALVKETNLPNYTVSGQPAKYTGIYRVVSVSGNTPGYLVTEGGTKYQEATIYKTGDSANNLYVQLDTADKDGLGKDATSKEISANEDYQLKPGEYLLFNYTKSNNADGTGTDQKVVVNEKYLGNDGIIIKPNVALKDSQVVHDTDKKSWTKKSGFDFGAETPAGMLALAPNEQIEIREINKIIFKEDHTYLFLILNNKNLIISANSTSYPSAKEEYTLQENEYLFYTDENQVTMAYYGEGTRIKVAGNIALIAKNFDANNLSIEDVIDGGISAIDWVQFTCSDTDSITVTEHQYITLAEGDILKSLKNGENAISTLNNTWVPCTAATWDDTGELPKINVDAITWEVRSGLDLNMSPEEVQILRKEDKITDSLTVNWIDSNSVAHTDTITPVEVDGTVEPVALKSSWDCQTSADTTTLCIIDENNEGVYVDAKIKVFKNDSIGVASSSSDPTYKAITLHNLNELWTSITSKDIADEGSSVKLNINVPAGKKGLIMFYIAGNANDVTKNPYIECTPNTVEPVIYNYYGNGSATGNDEDFEWWTDGIDSNKYLFHAGINVVEFKEACVINLFPDSLDEHSTTIIFSDLDIINGLNTEVIGYGKESSTSIDADKQLLVDLYEIVENTAPFYYNCPIESSNAVDLNLNLLNTTEPEILSAPHSWYDYNNINNKFVISEIDAEYLDKGIVLTRNSKLYR